MNNLPKDVTQNDTPGTGWATNYLELARYRCLRARFFHVPSYEVNNITSYLHITLPVCSCDRLPDSQLLLQLEFQLLSQRSRDPQQRQCPQTTLSHMHAVQGSWNYVKL